MPADVSGQQTHHRSHDPNTTTAPCDNDGAADQPLDGSFTGDLAGGTMRALLGYWRA